MALVNKRLINNTEHFFVRKFCALSGQLNRKMRNHHHQYIEQNRTEQNRTEQNRTEQNIDFIYTQVYMIQHGDIYKSTYRILYPVNLKVHTTGETR